MFSTAKRKSKDNADYEQQLGTAPLLPLITRMALPAVAAQLVNLLYSIVDRVYIGHIPEVGTNALAGVGVTGSIVILISAFALFVGGGGAPLAAIALGNGDRDRAGRILGNGFVMLVCFAILTSGITGLAMRPLLLVVGASESTLPYAADYLSIYLIGTLFVMLATGLNAFINTQGRAGVAMGSVVVGAVLNIVLDPILIFGFGMGVRGAAIATVISQGCSAAWVLLFLCGKSATLRLQLQYMKPDGKTIKSILALGISPFVMASTESLIGFVLNGTLRTFGDIYVSALAVMQSAMQIVSVPIAGFTQGATPVLSYNYGHGSTDRVRQGFRIELVVAFVANLVLSLIMIVFPRQVAGLFTNDPTLIDVVAKVMPVFMAGMTIFGLQRACQNTFVATGQAGISLFIALLRKVILLIPLVLILSRTMGVMGVFWGEAIADATAATLCAGIFAWRFPKILAGMKPPVTSHK